MIIGAAAFLYTSKLPGSHNFELCFHSLDIQANSTKLAEAPDLSNVPSEYHKFTDVFNKTKAETLSPYHPYNLKINLEESAQPLVGPIYSLSAFEQEALKEFIDSFIEENLNTGFIQPILSLHSAPVLFVKKKDGSLCLCINFCSLNRISKKDCYPLPLISNLLDLSYKAWVYSKIDLCHAYHLVYIADSCHMQVHLSRKLHSRGDATSEPYKPAFHSGHLSRNTSYGGAATLRILRLPWRRYSYLTQSSMTELLLSVSQY